MTGEDYYNALKARLSKLLKNNNIFKEHIIFAGSAEAGQKADKGPPLTNGIVIDLRNNHNDQSFMQGSHSDWKTWKIKKTFCSQGKVRKIDILGKSGNFVIGQGKGRKYLKVLEEDCFFFWLTPMLRG